MLKRIIKNMRKNGKLGNALALGLAMSVAVGSSAFALNYTGSGGSGNKPVNFTGYEYVSTSEIDVFFNKAIKDTTGSPVISQSYFIDKSLFSLKTHIGGSAVNPASIAIDSASGSGIDSDTTDTGFQNGTRVKLYFSSALSADTLYDLTISGLLLDSNGISLGNYSKGQDLKFSLRTPVSGTTWSSTIAPYVTFSVGAPGATSNVSWESNAILIFDRPISTGSLSGFLSTLSDSSHFVNTTASAGVVANNEAFTADANDKNALSNTFFFPETKQGNAAATVKNRAQSSNTYNLVIPSFTDYNGNTWTSFTNSLTNATVPSSTFSFTTNSTDYAGWENTGNPLVYLDTGMTAWTRDDATHITVYFPSNITGVITPVPASYDIYYAVDSGNNKYTTTAYTSAANVAYTGAASLSKQITVPGPLATKYWIRVVPKNSDGTPIASGFSVTQQASL